MPLVSPEARFYVDLRTQINTVEEVSFIDIFQGDVDINKSGFPSINTAVFIDFPNMNWKRLKQNIQQGFTTVVIYVSFRRLAASYATRTPAGTAVSTNTDEALKFYEISNKVYQVLSEYKKYYFSGLERVNSQPVKNDKSLFVYSHTFTTNLYDETAFNPSFSPQTIRILKPNIE